MRVRPETSIGHSVIHRGVRILQSLIKKYGNYFSILDIERVENGVLYVSSSKINTVKRRKTLTAEIPYLFLSKLEKKFFLQKISATKGGSEKSTETRKE